MVKSTKSSGQVPLVVLVNQGKVRVLQYLVNADPPLFLKEDVKNFNLMPYAYGSLQTLQFLLS